jgi:1-deoxy-D-xylulose-5-phosphate synthase
MGLSYLGPVDGHDVTELVHLLTYAKEMNRPVLLHVHTQKGRGYKPAEENPARFHGVGKFDPDTGLSLSAKKTTFSEVFGNTLSELAENDDTVCAITAAMPEGTGLGSFMKKFPSRTFDVGIAEEHAVSMAGGLAKAGMKPVVALYSTFLQRGYDQILQDIAMLRLHAVLAIDRAGLVGEDGETHHGVFDVGFLRQAQGMEILCPASTAELASMLRWAVRKAQGPVAVRYPRGGDGDFTADYFDENTSVAVHRQGPDGAIVTYGTLVNQAMKAAQILSREGIEVSVVRLTRLEPKPELSVLAGQKTILIAEEAIGGMAESLALHLQEAGRTVRIADLGREYVPHGDIASLYQYYGLDANALAAIFKEARNHEK